MYRDNPKILKLLQIGKPQASDLFPWRIYATELNLDDADIDDLIAVLTCEELNSAPSQSTEVWAALHAWRALGHLKTPKAIAPMISIFDRLCDDEWALDDLPFVFAAIGEPAIAPLSQFLQSPEHEEFAYALAASALTQIALQKTSLRAHILDIFSHYVQSPQETAYSFNGLLISNLIDLEAVELIEHIRSTYERKCVDESVCGDIEDVEIKLGLRAERDTERPSLAQRLFNLAEGGTANDIRSQHNLSSPGLPYQRDAVKAGRNDPCPCGSGKKYKKCCNQ